MSPLCCLKVQKKSEAGKLAGSVGRWSGVFCENKRKKSCENGLGKNAEYV